MWCGYLNGVIRALGMQKKAVLINLFCYWVFYPIVVYFFIIEKKLGFVGLWAALAVVQTIICVSLHYLIDFSDWQFIANEVQERSRKETKNNEIVKDAI